MKLFLFHLTLALKNLKHNKSYGFAVISTLALTLGALICALTLTFVMLYKPLPYPDQQQLTYVEHQLINNEQKIDGRAFTYPNLMHLYENHGTFSDVAMQYLDANIITSEPSKPFVEISYVTPEWFDIFAAKMQLGRRFEQSEKLNSYNPVAILSHQTWQDMFGAREDIIGYSISFGGKSFEVIGVLAAEFNELNLAAPGLKSAMFIPWDFNSVSDAERVRWGNDDGSLTFVGKLPTSISHTQASQRLSQLINDNWRLNIAEHNFFDNWSINIVTTPLSELLIQDNEQLLFLLVLGTLGLAIIAIANIANLYLARTVEQQHTLAINAAVGAPASGIISMVVAEAVILLTIALILSLLVAELGFSLMQTYLDSYLPRAAELSLNMFSVGVALAILFLLILLFIALNLRITNYRQLVTSLRSSGKGTKVQVSKKMRDILITSQVTIAIFLIFANGLLLLDAYKVMKKPLGYQTDNIHSLVMALPNANQGMREDTMQSLIREIMAHPSVAAVSQSHRPSAFYTLAFTEQQSGRKYSERAKDIDENYFALVGQPIIAGENVENKHRNDELRGIVVNEQLARKMSPDGDVIGLKINNSSYVSGIVKSIIVPGQKAPEPRFYFLSQASRNILLIKTKPNQTLSRDAILAIASDISPQLNIFSYHPIEHYKDTRLFASKTTTITTLTLIVVTLLLCSIGLYGILKYNSEMRRFEIGTRIAIGAKARDIIKLVCGENIKPLILGIVINLLIISTGFYIYSEQLNEYINQQLIWIFLISLITVSAFVLVASYLPVRKYINQPAIFCLRGDD
ncbi:ABC transporter permease [Thalassotalea sp. 1_MG-2023]|uniref:ABC transporter permease n=1 Tax=Thalassotalea sp. 1_MG-2023 TaxID=3062680 RepID=UPI0026E24F32|nr:ABC transporter permease [Thalassotalea sp. 1_MG-2023]MDO6428529.1 ABC transporter permease [Thalassotalea sp. 1_MG-2023]